MEDSELVAETLGEQVYEYVLANKRREWAGYRAQVTPFELMHRPDLAEVLEASGVELQHAVQKVAVPQSQATGQGVHELIRH